MTQNVLWNFTKPEEPKKTLRNPGEPMKTHRNPQEPTDTHENPNVSKKLPNYPFMNLETSQKSKEVKILKQPLHNPYTELI